MKIAAATSPRGIAMIIVMIVILVLGVLAGGFAYSMKVEIKLAQNSGFDSDMEWLGRSGIELARYVLVQSLLTSEPWDSINQKWAGGPMGTNDILETISLENNELGSGVFSIRIIDLERKVNINLINEVSVNMLQQALNLAGADPADIQTITDSFLDWVDLDENPHLSGTESSEYSANPNPGFAPYMAKNGPIDDLSELLLIRGITPDVYFGPGESGGGLLNRPRPPAALSFLNSTQAGGSVGLVELFTPISSGMININTASAQVLQLIPGIDPSLAQAIVTTRAGLDGTEGDEDDMPFRTPTELMNVPGMPPGVIQQSSGMFVTRSTTFEVLVDARIGQYRRQYVGVLRRNVANRDVQLLLFHAR
jgi:general secretion pathway protein K